MQLEVMLEKNVVFCLSERQSKKRSRGRKGNDDELMPSGKIKNKVRTASSIDEDEDHQVAVNNTANFSSLSLPFPSLRLLLLLKPSLGPALSTPCFCKIVIYRFCLFLTTTLHLFSTLPKFVFKINRFFTPSLKKWFYNKCIFVFVVRVRGKVIITCLTNVSLFAGVFCPVDTGPRKTKRWG